MKDRPILFSDPMVRAILAGTKTQTRRVLKEWDPRPNGGRVPEDVAYLPDFTCYRSTCPYGKPGDRLWVREAWKAHTTFDHLPPREIPESHVWYMADDGYKAESRYRQGMFMPRWASRITLEVTGVRVERLKDISEADAIAEGTPCYVCGGQLNGHSEDDCHCFHRRAQPSDYRMLWESINGPGSWDANPWVWVIDFNPAPPG